MVVPLCKLHLVAASRSYTCTQDGLDTVQLALVVFFLGGVGGNRVPQSDFPSYLSHSALLINTIAIITSSGRFSIHYTSFISVTHTLHLNYYHMQSQYKSVIQYVQQYKNLYAKFEASLCRNEGLLIRNSVLFKSWKFSIV